MMMDLLLIAPFVLFGLILWKALRRTPFFRVMLRQGRLQVTQGRVTPRALEQLAEICRAAGLHHGWVEGHTDSRGQIRLQFSRHFPPEVRQQLRNWWLTEGWTGPRPPSSTPPRAATR